MKWPVSEKYLAGFKALTLASVIALLFDQLFIPWRTEGQIQVVSLAGWLPENIMSSYPLFQAVTVAGIVGVGLWLFNFFPKVTSILSVILFVLSTSLYLQNEPFGDHRQSVFCLLMILLAAREYRLVQHYFFQVAAGIVISFYFLAGWEKVFYSGLAWINGTSLQIFVHYTGNERSVLRRLILHNVDVARVLQAGILILECGSFLLFGSRGLRRLWLVGLVGFHVGIEEIFGYRYFLHLLVVLYLFALPDWMDRKHDKIA
ncbi:hypothetical protein B9G69_015075 [Bdellovibrio sp. SKB1291214]|uniref:hypothetical protein n=1 Tax=Bdellovibrio sp. SKB1291214 TaxID=1732569 RepID=UPI000B518E3B|nr:hypothetical protein [Bdellovibrio sp. SKB1291214]UYL08363.1 hypothetical protein B9G69_015075 [Bdellovibrio sp. SKB1291214]